MVELRVVISDPKTGKSVQRIVKEENRRPFHGIKLGDKVRGELLELTGYEFTLTGGSDDSGFPMRRDVQGTAKKQILTTTGTGIKRELKKGQRIRKTVSGNTVGAQTAQLNLKIEKAGKEDIFPKPAEPEKKEEEKPAEAPKEEPKKEEKPAAKEEKKEVKKEKAPKEEKPKAEPKKEAKPKEEAKQ